MMLTIACFLLLFIGTLSQDTKRSECLLDQTQLFTISCSGGKVVQVREALYGRSSPGLCFLTQTDCRITAPNVTEDCCGQTDCSFLYRRKYELKCGGYTNVFRIVYTCLPRSHLTCTPKFGTTATTTSPAGRWLSETSDKGPHSHVNHRTQRDYTVTRRTVDEEGKELVIIVGAAAATAVLIMSIFTVIYLLRRYSWDDEKYCLMGLFLPKCLRRPPNRDMDGSENPDDVKLSSTLSDSMASSQKKTLDANQNHQLAHDQTASSAMLSRNTEQLGVRQEVTSPSKVIIKDDGPELLSSQVRRHPVTTKPSELTTENNPECTVVVIEDQSVRRKIRRKRKLVRTASEPVCRNSGHTSKTPRSRLQSVDSYKDALASRLRDIVKTIDYGEHNVATQPHKDSPPSHSFRTPALPVEVEVLGSHIATQRRLNLASVPHMNTLQVQREVMDATPRYHSECQPEKTVVMPNSPKQSRENSGPEIYESEYIKSIDMVSRSSSEIENITSLSYDCNANHKSQKASKTSDSGETLSAHDSTTDAECKEQISDEVFESSTTSSVPGAPIVQSAGNVEEDSCYDIKFYIQGGVGVSDL